MAALVMGGEVSMWGDDVNADRLWSPAGALRDPTTNFGPVARLAEHSCRLRMRGLEVGP
eukprot:gene54637-63621_t